jgi:hypothetical protein
MNWIALAVLMTIASPQDKSTQFIKPTLNMPEAPIAYYELAEVAIENCKNASPMHIDEDLIWTLVEIEKKYNLPPSLRGMLLAAACHESGFNPNAEGDRKFSKHGRPMAIGLFQMWKWWEKKYKIDRRDPSESAEAYMKHVNKQLKKVKKMCRYRTPGQQKGLWLSSWATAIRAPKSGGRCGERPKFYKVLKRWHKQIRQDRARMITEEEEYGDGC